MIEMVNGVMVEIGPNLMTIMLQLITLIGVIYAGYRAHQGALTGQHIEQVQAKNGVMIAQVADQVAPIAAAVDITKKGS